MALHWISPGTVATATAIFLNLPPIGGARHGDLTQLPPEAYQPLDKVSQMVADAVQPAPYVTGKDAAVFSLLSEVAARLVRESKPLDNEFAQIVDKEFWNLLR